MPFTKENAAALGKKGGKANIAVKENLWNFIAEGGRDKYMEKLDMLANGQKLSNPEQQFMDRVEKLFPYVKGKRGNVDEKGQTIPQNINILNTSTDELQRIIEAGSSS